MSPEGLEKELRRRLGLSSIEVRLDRRWAFENGKHPDALQVWDSGVQSGRPYCVMVLTHRGLPRAPGEWVFERMFKMRAEAIHQGRQSWAEDSVKDYGRAQDYQDEQTAARCRDRFADTRPMIRSFAGWGKIYATGGHRKLRRTRAGLLVPA